jgi:hypothetical protein
VKIKSKGGTLIKKISTSDNIYLIAVHDVVRLSSLADLADSERDGTSPSENSFAAALNDS